MNLRRHLTAALGAACAALALGAGAASASPSGLLRHDVLDQTSTNWGGYAVTGSGASATPTAFTNVSGSWVQPTATCSAGTPSYSAFWVGLGGFADSSRTLEQIGTEADCTASGTASYSVWYELVPSPPVDVSLPVQAGDSITASVTVAGTAVTFAIANTTSGASFSKTVTVASPDLSSAEWVAEAPSACGNRGGCRPLPLANFGSITFTNASATGSGHVGTISDPAWAATAVTLDGSSASRFPRGRFGIAAPLTTATPGALSSDGSSFAVTWAQASPSVDPGTGRPRGVPGRGHGWRPHRWGY